MNQDNHPAGTADVHLSRLCERLYVQLMANNRVRDAEIAALKRQYESMLSAKDAHISDLTARLHSTDHHNKAILQSMSWRLSSPYRLAGRAVHFLLRLMEALLRSPRGALLAIVRKLAEVVRGNAHLRTVFHRILNRAPSQFRARLSHLAPPSVEQSGHVVAGAMTPGAGGEWQWISNYLQK